MTRILLWLCALLWMGDVSAQVIPAPVGTTMQNAATANGNGTALANIGGYTVLTLQVSGTFTATINPEVSLDNSNWTAVSCLPVGSTTAVTTFTATGSWRCNLGGGYQFARARISGYASGSVTVTAAASYGGTARLNESTFDNLVVNTLTANTSITDNGLTASAYVKTDANKALTSQTTPIPCADGGTGLTSGTSGGVLAFTASCTLASSGALTANAMVVGGGAGAAPSVATGALTNGQIYTGVTSSTPLPTTPTAGSGIAVTNNPGLFKIDTSFPPPINCADSSGQHLNFQTSGNSWVCGTSSSAGTPAFGRATVSNADFTTSSTNLVDITGATVTFTTGAFPVFCGYTAQGINSVAGGINFYSISVDGADQAAGAGGLLQDRDCCGSYRQNASFTYQTAALTAGSHTIKVQMKVSANTGTVPGSAGDQYAFYCHEIR